MRAFSVASAAEPRSGRARGAVVVLLILALSGCNPAPTEPWNVIVLMVDTLRADRLGTYGHTRPTSPALDALAAEGVLFEAAWAQAPCTFPSVNSLLTSRYPVHLLEGQADGNLGLPEGVPSVAEMLASRGYDTFAVSASPIVRGTPSKHNKFGGFDRGFDVFDESCLWNHAGCVNRVGLELVDSRAADPGAGEPSRPFFLYLHYMDPHDPYRPISEWPRVFARSYDGPHEWVVEGDPNPISRMIYKGGERVEVGPADLEHLERLYDEEIRFFDAQLEHFLAELEARGLLENTLIAVVSDHGEAFLENGHVKHCYGLYDSTLRTPLVLRVPGAEGGRRIGAPAANLDLVPTILDYLDERLAENGQPVVSGDLQGRSLRPLIESKDPGAESGDRRISDHRVFASMGALRAVTDGRFKLHLDLATSELELYDLEDDPGETRDLSAERRHDFRRLYRDLVTWIREQEGASGDRGRRSRETLEKLEALGYL